MIVKPRAKRLSAAIPPKIVAPTPAQVAKVATTGSGSIQGWDDGADLLHPISLFASVTLQPTAGDGVNAIALKNPKGLPMELLELKFLISMVLPTVGFNLTGSSVSCNLTLGQLKVTNDFIPLWLFGQSFQLVDEVILGGAALNTAYLTFSWRLPRPLYLPPGTALVPQFQHTGQTNQPITVNVCASGRVLAKALDESKSFPVPYVAAYQSVSFDVSAAGTDSSKETDLINATGVDLHVSRMCGRISYNEPTATTEANVEDELIQVDMFDSRGYPWVPYPTAFRQVFSSITRTWEMPIDPVLPPGHYLIANITKNAPADNIPTAGTVFDQAAISLVGWREVSGDQAT